MLALSGRQGLLVMAGVLAAVSSGALLGHATPRGLLLIGALAFAAVAVVTFEAPIVAFGAIVILLGLASEENRDDRLLGLTGEVYGSLVSVISLPYALLGLLAVVLLLSLNPTYPTWPGAPAAAALILLAIAVANAAWFGPLQDSLFVARPLAALVLALFVGYWVALRYGIDVPLTALVVAAMLSIPGGLYNSFSAGDVSYYDASFVYLIGVAAILVLFRVVDIGLLHVPFLLLSTLVIVLSLRRAAIVAVGVALVITAIASRRRGLIAVVGVAVGAVCAVELAFPELLFTEIEGLANYFTGASGQDFSVNYRRYETANAWLNIEPHRIWGIGPATDWTVYRTFDGKFIAQGTDYLHNSYLWVWLRYGFIGLLAYAAFFVVTAFTLLRRGAPDVCIIVGASIVGLAIALTTASWLTTTTRWPLTVGLFVGMALAARRLAESDRGLPDEGIRAPAPR